MYPDNFFILQIYPYSQDDAKSQEMFRMGNLYMRIEV